MFDNLRPVALTPLAVAEALKIMHTKNIPEGYGLRVGVRGGHGCGGVSFIIGFDKKKDSDLSYQVDGISVFIDKKHTMYLIGKAVDFYEGADARGFIFIEQEAIDRGGWHKSDTNDKTQV